MFDEIKAIIIEKVDIDPAKITPQSSFEDLELDSLDMVDIIMDMEDKYDVTIDVDEKGMKTIEDLIKYVEELKA